MSKIFMQFATMQHFSIPLGSQTLDSQMNTGDGSSLAPSPPYAISCFFMKNTSPKWQKQRVVSLISTCCLAFFNVFFLKQLHFVRSPACFSDFLLNFAACTTIIN